MQFYFKKKKVEFILENMNYSIKLDFVVCDYIIQ